MSNLDFLKNEWPKFYEAAKKAEDAVYPDPRTACFYARWALELGVKWAFKHDESLKLPYQENLSSLIHEPTFKIASNMKQSEIIFIPQPIGKQHRHLDCFLGSSDSVKRIS